ncbi:MAG TPA: hypothetical protein VN877_06805 [Opitutaceae bacterium]|nr:hypothetical protein [Opitutaceae bacterium]
MNLPSDTPRLPKWIFFLGYVSLLGVAWIIHDGSDHPWSGGPLLAIVVCVALAAVLVALPYVADYAHSQDEALDNRQRALQTLAATVAASSEQIAIATAGLQKLTGLAQDNAGQLERVAQQIQERIAELRSGVAGVKRDDGEAVAKLEAAAKRISKAVAELEAKAARPPEIPRAAPAAPISAGVPELPPVLLSRMVEIKPAISSPSRSPFDEPAPAAVAAPEAPPAAPTAPEPAAPAPEAPPVAAAPRRRSPRKAAPAAPAPADLALDAPAPDAPASAGAPEASEPAVSADGATRLVVTAYIGIGNRLFIRGEGPGLSWEKGVPLSFVSIGKWRWETNDAAAAVRFKLYKNDEVECTALGERSLGPGAQLDLSASF